MMLTILEPGTFGYMNNSKLPSIFIINSITKIVLFIYNMHLFIAYWVYHLLAVTPEQPDG